jgi:hypothetical protein
MIFALATAAAVSRRGEREPGRITSSVLLGLYAITWMIPDSSKPWADPGDSRWDTGAPWWWVAFGVAVLVGVVTSWDTRVGSSPLRLRGHHRLTRRGVNTELDRI